MAPRQAHAHANLARSEPAANSRLSAPPPEVRLFFTEPVEPRFSRITLRDAEGTAITLPAAEVNTANPYQLFTPVDDLPDGLYTVSWRVVSAADGHTTEGSFAFGVNVAVTAAVTALTVDESVAPQDVAVRWLNLVSMALLLGALTFTRFTWRPALADDPLRSAGEQRLGALAWLGWLLVGGVSGLLLLMQAASVADAPPLSADTFSAAALLLTSGSYYGLLWLLRVACWLGVGVMLWLARAGNPRAEWGALLAGALLLLAHSAFSHAVSATDAAAAVAGQWLHLLATAFWVGGLLAFIVALALLRAHPHTPQQVGRLVAHFSNSARVAVAALVISGIYAAWLHVGSWPALTETVYGQALILKTALFLPVLALAGVNLLLTHRRLQAGAAVWVGRLRALVGVEVILLAGMLVAAGVLTSAMPARGVMAVRDAQPPQTEPPAYFAMEIVNDQMLHLEIVPGYVGENTFIVQPFDAEGNVIRDASLIRLRFTNLDQNLGESELRIRPDGPVENGLYRVTGANISTTGQWRIRMTVQRPAHFDVVSDFIFDAALPPAAPMPEVDARIPPDERAAAALGAGVVLLLAGVGFGLARGQAGWDGGRVLATLMLLVGALFIAAALTGLRDAPPAGDALTVTDAYANPGALGTVGAVYLTLHNATGTPERLLSATTDAAVAVALHSSSIEDEIMRMTDVAAFEVPARGSLTLAPGGDHLMLEVLHRTLNTGDTFTVTLRFASGQTLTTPVTVR